LAIFLAYGPAVPIGAALQAVGQVDPDRMPRADGEPLPVDEKASSFFPTDAKTIILSREKYEELLQEIKRLKKQLESHEGKPSLPSACRVTGRLAEGNLIQLHVRFDFEVEKNETKRVLLGCGLANPTEAKLDGQLGLFKKTEDGFVVLTDKPGMHEATLDMELPLSGKENERGFAIDLPPAVTKSLELTLPKEIKSAKVGKELFETRPNGETSLLKPPGLDWSDRLEVAWTDQGAIPASAPQLDVESRIVVRVEDKQVVTDAEILIKPSAGQSNPITLFVPPQAEWIKKPTLDERILSFEVADASRSLRILRLKEPGAKPVSLSFKVVQQRGAGILPIGPFAVLKATSQQGSVIVCAPNDVQIRFHTHGFISQRNLTDDEDRRFVNAMAAFTYFGILNSDKPSPSPAVNPHLEIGIEPIRGTIEAKVTHYLQLVQPQIGEKPSFRLTTTIDGESFRAKLTSLQIQLPPDYRLDEGVGIQPSAILQGPPIIDPLTRIAHITLLYSKPGPFKLILEGIITPTASTPPLAVFLPKPLGALDRGAQITVQLPETLEWASSSNTDTDAEMLSKSPHKISYRFQRMPSQMALNWKAYKSELSVRSFVDMNVLGRRVRVRQQFLFESGAMRPQKVILRVPEILANTFEVKKGGKLETQLESGLRQVALDSAGDKHIPLEIEYQLDLPGAESGSGKQVLTVPMVTAPNATSEKSLIRIWTKPGVAASQVGESWEERGPEIVAAYDSLPNLVLHTDKPNLPLELSLFETAVVELPAGILERGLISVSLSDEGTQQVRARYRIKQVKGSFVDLLLPAPPLALNLKTLIEGKAVAWQQAGGDRRMVNLDRVARVPVPTMLPDKAWNLELIYQTPQPRFGLWSLSSYLEPPVLLGASSTAPVFWKVNVPSSFVPVQTESELKAEQRWEFRGGLLVPKPTESSTDLERWFQGRAYTEGEGEEIQTTPNSVFLKPDFEPIRLIYLPRRAWLMLCSFVILVIGFLLYYRPVRMQTLGLIAIPFIIGLGILAQVWPGILTTLVYGCEPGLAVLVVVLAVQWIAAHRHRRRLLFMRGFSHPRNGSSSHKSKLAGAGRSAVEPSTVDAPKRAVESNQKSVAS
jgi:hypothetical protein